MQPHLVAMPPRIPRPQPTRTPWQTSWCAFFTVGSKTLHPLSRKTRTMGQFFYANSPDGFDIDDRALTHLRIVIYAKLRRNESFGFSWDNTQVPGVERISVWLNASVPLRFSFTSGEPIAVNRSWLEQLTQSADTPAGLYLSPEPSTSRAL